MFGRVLKTPLNLYFETTLIYLIATELVHEEDTNTVRHLLFLQKHDRKIEAKASLKKMFASGPRVVKIFHIRVAGKKIYTEL